MPVPLNLTLDLADPFITLHSGGNWQQIHNVGSQGVWDEWIIKTWGGDVPYGEPDGGISFPFNGSAITVYGNMQWEGERFNVSLSPSTYDIQMWGGCTLVKCLSPANTLYSNANLNELHNFKLVTNYELGETDGMAGPTLFFETIDITTSVPGEGDNLVALNESLPTSSFAYEPAERFTLASNGSLYTEHLGSTLSVNFTGTALLLTTAESYAGFEPYWAAIDMPLSEVVRRSNRSGIGSSRTSYQPDGATLFFVSGLEDTNHTLNVQTQGAFAVSGAYTFKAGLALAAGDANTAGTGNDPSSACRLLACASAVFSLVSLLAYTLVSTVN